MDAAGPAAKPSSLKAELAAKCSRISELEDRVSLLEAENARLRKALARRRGLASARGSGRLAAGLRGSNRKDAVKPGGSAACDVLDFGGDGEDCVELVDAHSDDKGPNPEEGAVAVEGEEDEADLGEEGGEGGGGSDSQEHCCAGLEDDDVSATPGGTNRRAAARVVTSDSEDEDHGELGSANKDDVDGHEGGGVTASRKRGLCAISGSDDENVTEVVPVVASNAASRVSAPQIESGDDDDDDMVPICQVLKKMRKEREDDADDGSPEARGCSAPTTRRSARLLRNQLKGELASRQVNNFVEPKEYEDSEDDMDVDADMDGFINDDDSSENASDQSDASDTPVLNEESSEGPEESDIVADYTSVMARIGRKKKAEDWKFEGDMLAAFAEHPELRLKAVCALYRKQTQEEQLEKAALIHNGEGFNHIDARRGSHIAEFLLDGDRDGPLKKTISDLEEYDPYALGFCHKVAKNYSKQLFAIYQNKEDPDFHP
ncbi:hypothetical protein HU200_066687 [Digitaria exilis]|uniref:Uncharacterized protein n=1 Tax=Digitaria exilis TaxID=1010633 RepID=A0A835A624_9POAL|nr:hypothetical protein HU200_066687 [Digitaria exilis]CAB3475728.1 unnamed protein product [Digitaria exilis]